MSNAIFIDLTVDTASHYDLDSGECIPMDLANLADLANVESTCGLSESVAKSKEEEYPDPPLNLSSQNVDYIDIAHELYLARITSGQAYYPIPDVPAEGVVPLIIAPEGMFYEGPDPFAGVFFPRLVISKILEFLPFSQFLRARLVCKKFNETAKKTPSQWKSFLHEKGPKQISEHSIHRTDAEWLGPCKMGKNGKCNIASHYPWEELSPKFNEWDCFAAFHTVIEFVANKKETSVKSRVKTLGKRIERLDECIKPFANVPDMESYLRDYRTKKARNVDRKRTE